nr:polysaccharide biosynthesis C-terminal domain-containing protein [Neobittarella massiliensis]
MLVKCKDLSRPKEGGTPIVQTAIAKNHSRHVWLQRLWGAGALTVLALFLRTLSISFKIYLSGQIGAAGMGLYQLIYSVYGFGCTLACGGLGLGVTTLCSRAIAKKQWHRVPQVVLRALAFAAVLGCIATGLLYFGAAPVSKMLGQPILATPLRLFSVSLPFAAISGCLQGYFYATGEVVRSELSQVLKRFTKMGIVMAAFAASPPRQMDAALALIFFASSLSEIVPAFYLSVLYRVSRKKFTSAQLPPSALTAAKGSIALALVKICLPLAVCQNLQSAFHTLENTLVPQGFAKSGIADAMERYGVLSGMAMPLLSYPAALLVSFSMLLIPAIVRLHTRGQREKLGRSLSHILRITFVFCCGVMAVFLFFPGPVSGIFSTKGVAVYLRLLAPLCPLIYMDHVTDCMLKGLGLQFHVMIQNLTDMMLTVVLLYFLLPVWGLAGYLFTLYCTTTYNLVAGWWLLRRRVDFSYLAPGWVAKPLLCCLIAGFVATRGLPPVLSAFPVRLVLFLVLYFALLFLCRDLTSKDLHRLRALLG